MVTGWIGLDAMRAEPARASTPGTRMANIWQRQRLLRRCASRVQLGCRMRRKWVLSALLLVLLVPGAVSVQAQTGAAVDTASAPVATTQGFPTRRPAWAARRRPCWGRKRAWFDVLARPFPEKIQNECLDFRDRFGWDFVVSVPALITPRSCSRLCFTLFAPARVRREKQSHR